ncbi:MAG TPA: uridylate kinase [Micromonosporaceae bacterium]
MQELNNTNGRVAVDRAALIGRLADLIASCRPTHPLRVAIDGPDAAGKSTFAGELGVLVSGQRSVIRASADDFQHPATERYRRGRLASDGYYLDAFDHEAMRIALLGPRGNGRYRTAVFDYRRDAPVDRPASSAVRDAVLLFDGVFLLRPELRGHFDVAVYVHVSPAESLRRALVRDAPAMGGDGAVRVRYERRYLPAQALYRETASPLEHADAVIDNEDVDHPYPLKWPRAMTHGAR